MKTKLYPVLFAMAGFIFSPKANAQTNAMNFDIVDCNGNPHNLFNDLDAGKAVIIEFFMTSCGSCITAGNTLEDMKANLLAEFPGMIKAYAFGYNNSYSCTTVNNWITTNGFSSIPSDSGATQVAYYGGMGMPTIVILGGGTSHLVLGSPYVGFVTSDTTTMANDIRNFLNGTNVEENISINDLSVFPNPANADMNISFNMKTASDIIIEIVDLTGRVIKTVFNGEVSAGVNTKSFNVTEIAQGNYMVRISSKTTILHQNISIIH
ncbi:MAG: T9SS type A sorting domain-containing protein [Bacteroidota bacterium]